MCKFNIDAYGDDDDNFEGFNTYYAKNRNAEAKRLMKNKNEKEERIRLGKYYDLMDHIHSRKPGIFSK